MNFHDNTYPIPGWLLRINEVSNGHLIVSLTDRNNRRIELSGDADEVIAMVDECIDWAKALERKPNFNCSQNL